uniref:Pectinesterase n=1 Tax=Oryza glumipatula TaxID=40148 RepID=A0A0E0BGA5_9ORYZ
MAEKRMMLLLMIIVGSALSSSSIHGDDATVVSLSHTDRWIRRRLQLIHGMVDGKAVVETVVVCKDGSGNFTTITQALGAAPPRGKFGIFVKAGVYEETVNITRADVVLWGEGIGKTVITGSRSCPIENNKTKTDMMPWTATVTVQGHGFIAQDVTIENKAGPTGTPAVALRCDSNRSLIHRCRIDGYQDTLWAQNNQQVYLRCDIAGTIDFVYGNAKAIFQYCRLLVRNPGNGKHNAITAQGRNSEESGFVFQGCNITAMEGESLAGVDTYLGRPWKNHSRVVFMGCFMSDIINPDGWVHWNKATPVEETTRTVEYLAYGNKGAGAETADRVKWKGVRVITEAEANRFTVDHFINGNQWVPNLVNGEQINYTHGAAARRRRPSARSGGRKGFRAAPPPNEPVTMMLSLPPARVELVHKPDNRAKHFRRRTSPATRHASCCLFCARAWIYRSGHDRTPAVALRCDSNRSLIHRCRIDGYQDTLWAQNNQQVYLRCDIAGTIDFVYGNAKAIFQYCRLLVRNPGNGKHNAITAQGRNSEESGFVFQGCNITAMEGESLAGVDTYLGRPWKNHSRVVFMGCFMSDIINPDGWVHWNKATPVEETTRTVEYLAYGNKGAGAETADRVKWKGVRVITEAEANRFTVDHFINGNQWVPNLVNGEQINYTHGLI